MVNNLICHIGSDVTEDMIRGALEIDVLVYATEFQGNYNVCVSWWKRNKDIYVMIEDRDTRQIVGCINAMPLNDDCYKRIKSGLIIDIDINPNEIEQYDKPGSYKLYLSSIAIHPDYQRTNVFRALSAAFMSYIKELEKRGIVFSSILADAVSSSGERLCRIIGMNRVADSNHSSVIYEGEKIETSLYL